MNHDNPNLVRLIKNGQLTFRPSKRDIPQQRCAATEAAGGLVESVRLPLPPLRA
jgi:hypothetical protein